MTLNTNIHSLQARNFWVTSYASEEVEHNLQEAKLRNIINTLNIKNYSDSIQNIDFIFMVLSDDVPTWRESRSKYLWGRKILSLIAWLNYEEFAKANVEEAMKIQANAYLNTILSIPSIRGLKKNYFNHEKFYQDVKALFEKEKWL